MNIVEGAVITMPLFFCATKAIAHLLFFQFCIASPKVWTMQSKFLMCYFSAKAIIATGSSWACADDMSLPHRFDLAHWDKQTKHDSSFPIASLV